jgi:hypothetical protein
MTVLGTGDTGYSEIYLFNMGPLREPFISFSES